MENKYIVGGLILAAVIGIVVYNNSKSKKEKVTEESPKSHPLEGKNVAGKDANGNYDGGAVYLIKNGKKLPYGNNSYDTGNGLNWDTYCSENDCYTTLVLLSQEELSQIPNA